MDVTLQLTRYPGLDDRITILRAADEVDAVFVRTERFNILVDTLATPALCRQALELLAGQMAGRPPATPGSNASRKGLRARSTRYGAAGSDGPRLCP